MMSVAECVYGERFHTEDVRHLNRTLDASITPPVAK